MLGVLAIRRRLELSLVQGGLTEERLVEGVLRDGQTSLTKGLDSAIDLIGSSQREVLKIYQLETRNQISYQCGLLESVVAVGPEVHD